MFGRAARYRCAGQPHISPVPISTDVPRTWSALDCCFTPSTYGCVFRSADGAQCIRNLLKGLPSVRRTIGRGPDVAQAPPSRLPILDPLERLHQFGNFFNERHLFVRAGVPGRKRLNRDAERLGKAWHDLRSVGHAYLLAATYGVIHLRLF